MARNYLAAVINHDRAVEPELLYRCCDLSNLLLRVGARIARGGPQPSQRYPLDAQRTTGERPWAERLIRGFSERTVLRFAIHRLNLQTMSTSFSVRPG